MNNDEACKTLGHFISLSATFEFITNAAIECIYHNDKIIDHLQRQSLEIRIEYLKQGLKIISSTTQKFSVRKSTKERLSERLETIYSSLDRILNYYVKEIKPFRDLIAHSPILQTPVKAKVVSSRRHKPNAINSVDIKKIQKNIIASIPIQEDLNWTAGAIKQITSQVLGDNLSFREIS